MYLVDVAPQARKFLKTTDAHITERILEKIESLRTDPFPWGAERLKGTLQEFQRIRIGDYRVLYSVDHSAKTILIVKIDDRKRVYD